MTTVGTAEIIDEADHFLGNACKVTRHLPGSAPRRSASKSRTMDAKRIARFWFKNITSVPEEVLFSAKNGVSISIGLPISVSRGLTAVGLGHFGGLQLLALKR